MRFPVHVHNRLRRLPHWNSAFDALTAAARASRHQIFTAASLECSGDGPSNAALTNGASAVDSTSALLPRRCGAQETEGVVSIVALLIEHRLHRAQEAIHAFLLSATAAAARRDFQLVLVDAGRMFGYALDAALVDDFLCSTMHIAALHHGRIVEAVIVGICVRVERHQLGSRSTGEPSLLCRRVKETLAAAMRFVGSNFHPDCVLSLVEASLACNDLAVPLAASVVGVAESCQALGWRRTGAWLREYSVDVASKSPSLVAVCDHLRRLWPASGDNKLVPAESGWWWRCASCGKTNSVRYAFCPCSAGRFAYWECVSCGCAQDQRNEACLHCCSRPLEVRPSSSRAVVKWTCSACGRTNPGLSLHKCCYCHTAKAALSATATTWSGGESSPWLWFCGACHAFHRSADLVCPTFVNCEWSPAAACRPWGPVQCPRCLAEHDDPFVVTCGSCSSDMTTVGVSSSIALLASAPRRHVLVCVACSEPNVGARATLSCVRCAAPLSEAEYAPVAERRCSCGSSNALSLNVVCDGCNSVCTELVASSATDWWTWGHVVQTLQCIAAERRRMSALRLLEVLSFVCRKTEAALEVPHPQTHEVLAPVVLSVRVVCAGAGAPAMVSARLLVLCDRIWALGGNGGEADVDGSSLRERRCMECRGTHPAVTCIFARNLEWTCASCGTANRNDNGLARYLCLQCLTVREEVTPVAECWRCEECMLVNLDCECHCIYCGVARAETPTSSMLPFAPIHCPECGDVHVDATCPKCRNDGHDPARAPTTGDFLWQRNSDVLSKRPASETEVPSARLREPALLRPPILQRAPQSR